jgi:MFS family permease
MTDRSRPPGSSNVYSLCMVSAVYMLNSVDRSLMAICLQPIKLELHLTDTQLGFVTGIAFGVFYATAGLPIARLADRGDRVTLASVAIALWGLVVMSSILITNFLQLALSRVMAAIGEAGCKPPTYSLIGDYFPERAERTRALGVYTGANYLSTLPGMVLGGWLAQRYGWRWTFFLMGIPGLVLAAVVASTVREPRRLISRKHPVGAHANFSSMISLVWRRRALRRLTIALILVFTITQAMQPWQAAFMARSHGMGTAEIGLWLGLITSIGGAVGAIGGGYLSGRLLAKSEKRNVAVGAAMVALITVFYVAFLIVPDGRWALLALSPTLVFLGAFLGSAYSLMQRLVPDNSRASMMALIMLLANLIGFGLGPQLVGIMSDTLAPVLDAQALRAALFVMSFIPLCAAYNLFRVAKTIDADLRENSCAAATAP